MISVVLDDAVMDDYHALFARILRMRVDGAGFAMGRPAGVTDAAETADSVAGVGHFHQVFQPSLRLDDLDMVVIFIAHGDAPAESYPAVFQLRESGEQNRCRLFYSYISNDSTHKHLPPDF